MSGSSSDVGGSKTPPRVADTPPAGSGSRSANTPTSDGRSAAAEGTRSGDATVIRRSDVSTDAPVVVTNTTPEEDALGAVPRTGPLPGDEPEANPSHPSSLRIRNSDGEPVLKTVRGGTRSVDDRPPGWEAAEDPRAVPSHPSKIEPDPSGVSAFRLVDANAEQDESDADVAADVSDERKALAQDAPKGTKFVTYRGAEAVTLVIPDGGGYDGAHTEGATVNFRPGQTQAVPTKSAAWLLKHPRFDFED